MHPKGENIVWTCVNDNIIEENQEYKAIGIYGFDYKLFQEKEGGGGVGVERVYIVIHIWTI